MVTMRAEIDWENGKPGMHARAGMHKIVIDEPAANGGDDLGPNPMQYLMSCLGGCFIAMGRMVAGEMDLTIDHLRCRVEGDLNRDGLLGKDPAVRAGCQEIRMTITAKTAEPEDKMKVWLEKVEARCPVKDCIENPTSIKVQYKLG